MRSCGFTISNDNPYTLDWDVFVRFVHADVEDELGEVADLQAFPLMSVWNPECAGCFRMACFAILKAPSVNLKILLMHQEMVSGKGEGRKLL